MKQRVSMMLAALFVALLGGQASAQSTPSLFGFLPFVPVGAVYTMSNAADRNAVLIFERSFDGRLRAAGAVPTKGTGSGGGLGNQGGVVLSDDERWLIAVNAGSADISVFQVQRRGLRLVSRTPSGGTRPISVRIHRRLVYVLNAGSDSITGFRLSRQGRLDPLTGSTRPLSGAAVDPAQIEFSPGEDVLVVTEKATNQIVTYQVDRDGLPGDRQVQPAAGQTPFGFAFGRRDRPPDLLRPDVGVPSASVAEVGALRLCWRRSNCSPLTVHMVSPAQHTTTGDAPARFPDIREFIWDRFVALLDVSVVIYVGLTALYLVTGPIDARVFTVRGIAKPLLLMTVLVSLRAAVPGNSWLSRLVSRGWRRTSAAAAAFASRVSWAPAAVDAGIALLATRVVSKAIGFVANVVVPSVGPRPFEMPFEHIKFAETFAAWDSGWYFDIAQRGYYYNPDGQSSIPFFPLYPLLMRAAAWPFGGTDRALWIAGVVISYVCFFLALVLLHRLTERVAGSREAARRAVLYVAVFPFSYFFSRVYTESLFLLVTVAAVSAAVSSRWTVAGLFGALATLTRPNGLLIVVPLGILALQSGRTWRERLQHVSPLIAVPFGFGLYCGFVYHLTGHPFAWLDAQKHWGYSIGNRPWAALQQLIETMEARGLYRYLVTEREGIYASIHALVALTFIALTPSVFRRLGIAMGSYVAIGLLIPLTGNALEGLGRYAATLFPVFILLGMITSQRIHDALLIIGSLGLVLLITLFVTLHPIY